MCLISAVKRHFNRIFQSEGITAVGCQIFMQKSGNCCGFTGTCCTGKQNHSRSITQAFQISHQMRFNSELIQIRNFIRHFTGAELLPFHSNRTLNTIVQTFKFYQIARIFAVISINQCLQKLIRTGRHQTARSFSAPDVSSSVRNHVNIGKFGIINSCHLFLL